MFNFIKEILGKDGITHDGAEKTIKDDTRLAASVILLETAYSDSEFSDEERGLIVDILKKDFEINDEEARDLIETGTDILKNDTNKWRYTNIINNSYSNDQKLMLIQSVWELIYADNRLDKYEDHLVHRLSKVLHIPHDQLIEAKLKVIGKRE
ncbi:MAG: TerB family tellurite resistance protein [Elusimicrobia bacterium]|nr:TerB family tellurite resistance protein [Elusimicrobiota bacterium]